MNKKNFSSCCVVEILSKSVVIDKSKPDWVLIYECEKCGNEVKGLDLLLLDENEWKCVNRTKLIERMLE